MRIVSPLLKKIVYPSLSTVGVFRRTILPGLAVVTYHGVLPREYEPVDSAFDGNLVTAETLRRQLRLLKSHYRVISPEEVLAWRRGDFELPVRAVLVTCDDGLLNNLTEMLPVLQQEGVRCLFFVTGGSLGEVRRTLWYEELFLLLFGAAPGRVEVACQGISMQMELASREQRRTVWWNAVQRLSTLSAYGRDMFLEELRHQVGLNPMKDVGAGKSPASRRYGLLTLSELRTLVAEGMMIGAHTMSHPLLSQMPIELVRGEIAECRTQLDAALQTPIWAFAYPFGDAASVNAQVLAIPKEAGYEAAFLNFGGGLGAGLPAFAIPRIHVTAEMSLSELDAHLCGFYTRLQRRAGRLAPVAEAANG